MLTDHAATRHPVLPLWSYTPARGEKIAISTRREFEIMLVSSALRDETCRSDLLSDSRAAVQREFGIYLPETVRLHVLEEREDCVFLILPHNPFAGDENDLHASTGNSLEDVASWVLQDRRGALLDPERSLRLVVHAWRNKDFREEFVADPRTALMSHLQFSLPEEHHFIAFEETGSDVFVILPQTQTDTVTESLDQLWSEVNLGPQYMQVMHGSGQMCTSTCIVTNGCICTACCFTCKITCILSVVSV
jgi:hypothetical protein